MEISSKAIEQIKDVRVTYEKKQKVFDRPFFDEIFLILSKEEQLRNKIKLVYDEKRFGFTAYVEDDEIHIVLKNLIRDCFARASQWMDQFENMNIIEVQNLFGIYAVFHELTHIWQTYGCNRDPEINRLYKDLFDKTQNLTFYQVYMYNRHAMEFCFERNAELEAFKEVARIYSDSEYKKVAEIFYMNEIDNYGSKHNNPVDYTLKLLKMKNDYDFSSLSNIEKLEHGIMVEEDVMKEAEITILHAKDKIDYSEARKKLLEL